MAIVVLLSPGGSPGVTTAALALTLTWPRDVIMAECDPAGGSVLSGLWRGQVSAGHAGLLRFALAAQRDPAAAAAQISNDVLPLDSPAGGRFVLAAVPDPGAGRQIAATWPALARGLAAASADIIADVGRFDASRDITPLLAAADLVLMMLRPTVRHAAAAESRLALLAQARPADGLILIGKGGYGSGAQRAATRALGVPVIGVLPDAAPAAAVLSDGAEAPRGFGRSPLMRAADRLASTLAQQIAGPATAPHLAAVRP